MYVEAVREGRFEDWVRRIDGEFQAQDPGGTPAAVLDGRVVDLDILNDPEALGALIRG